MKSLRSLVSVTCIAAFFRIGLVVSTLVRLSPRSGSVGVTNLVGNFKTIGDDARGIPRPMAGSGGRDASGAPNSGSASLAQAGEAEHAGLEFGAPGSRTVPAMFVKRASLPRRLQSYEIAAQSSD